MITEHEAKIEAVMDCVRAWACCPVSAEECAEHVRRRAGELGIDSAQMAEAKQRLETTTIDPVFCRAVAACL